MILISHDRDFLDRVVSAVIVPEGDGVWNEYAGGYSDMLTQRGADIASTKPVRATDLAGNQGRRRFGRGKAKKKLSFNEKFALDNLPKQIAKLEGEIAHSAKEARRSRALCARPQGVRLRHRGDRQGAGRARRRRKKNGSQLEMLREEIEG